MYISIVLKYFIDKVALLHSFYTWHFWHKILVKLVIYSTIQIII